MDKDKILVNIEESIEFFELQSRCENEDIFKEYYVVDKICVSQNLKIEFLSICLQKLEIKFVKWIFEVFIFKLSVLIIDRVKF